MCGWFCSHQDADQMGGAYWPAACLTTVDVVCPGRRLRWHHGHIHSQRAAGTLLSLPSDASVLRFYVCVAVTDLFRSTEIWYVWNREQCRYSLSFQIVLCSCPTISFSELSLHTFAEYVMIIQLYTLVYHSQFLLVSSNKYNLPAELVTVPYNSKYSPPIVKWNHKCL